MAKQPTGMPFGIDVDALEQMHYELQQLDGGEFEAQRARWLADLLRVTGGRRDVASLERVRGALRQQLKAITNETHPDRHQRQRARHEVEWHLRLIDEEIISLAM
jgi:hypothetical protein